MARTDARSQPVGGIMSMGVQTKTIGGRLTFAERYGIAGGTCDRGSLSCGRPNETRSPGIPRLTGIEHFLSVWSDVTQSEEQVDILGQGAIRSFLHADDEVGGGMPGNLRLLVKSRLERYRLALAERLDLEGGLIRHLGRRRHGKGLGIQVELDVLRTSERPLMFVTRREGRFRFIRVEARVSLAQEEGDRWDLGVWTLFPSCVVFVLEPGVQDWAGGERRLVLLSLRQGKTLPLT
jgi:hypothetical protein